MNDEFGSEWSAVILRDLVLTDLGDLTGEQALEASYEPKEVWLAICRTQNIPSERWAGLNKKPTNRHAE
jgi:hypothetical protein